MKKFLTLLCAFISCVLCFTGCVNVPDDPNLEDDYSVNLDLDPDMAGSLSVLVPSATYEEDLIDAVIEGFKLEYPNVSVMVNTFQYDNYNSVILQQIQSGTLPDVIWTNSTSYYFLVSMNAVAHLDPYIEASERQAVFNLEEDYFSDYFDMGRYDGKLYMVPRSVDGNICFYNTEIFAAAGITESEIAEYEDGWTWTEFLGVCEKIKQYYERENKTGYYPIDHNFEWESVYNAMMASYGAEFFDEEGNVAVDSEETLAVLQVVRDMVTAGYVPDTGTTASSSYESGTGAMLFQSAGIARMDMQATLRGKVDLLPFPLMDTDTPKIGCGIAGYAINSRLEQEQRDLAWAFLNYMISYDGQQAFGDAGLTLPSIRRDLGLDNPDAEWAADYRDRNLAAYTFGDSEGYKVDCTFFKAFDPGLSSDLLDITATMFHDARDLEKDLTSVIETCRRDLDECISD